MSGKESNQGFIDLHTPMGFVALIFAFLLLISFIAAGATLFKIGFERDREMRKRLRSESKPPTPQPPVP